MQGPKQVLMIRSALAAIAAVFFLVFSFPVLTMQVRAADGSVLLVDDFDQAAPRNLLGGEMGVVANGGVAALDFPKAPLADLTPSSLARVTFELDGSPGYAFLWMKLGRKTGQEGASEYLDLRDASYLSFRLKAGRKTDFKIEIHEDLDGDGRYTYGKDASGFLYLSLGPKMYPLEDGWDKVLIPLARFRSIKDWSKILELVFVFEKDRTGSSGEIFFEDILFAKIPLNLNDAGREKAFFTGLEIRANGAPLGPDTKLGVKNRFEMSYRPGADAAQLESIELQIKPEGAASWSAVASIYQPGSESASLDWEAYTFAPPASFALRIVGRDAYGGISVAAGPFEKLTVPRMTDEEFLDLTERKAFLFFSENQHPGTGLFYDTSLGGDASIAVTGFGLTALVIGAERGWMAKDEAARRAALCLDTFLTRAENKDGFYYHFLKPDTAAGVKGTEVSTVDTALLVTGVITAGEYFGGEVKAKADQIYRKVNWPAFLNQDENSQGYMNFHHGWMPEEGLTDFFWDYYTDETLLVTLLAIGSPSHPVSPGTFYSFVRRKGAYEGGEEFVFTWHGALFSYQYAHPWFDLRGISDKEGIDWFDNARIATAANRRFSIDHAQDYRTYGPDSWGITSMRLEDKYVMHYGGLPNGQNKAEHDGTISPSGPAGSMPFTPYLSLRVLKHLYQRHPQIWGRYGFKDSVNLDRNWVSPIYYGLGEGLLLISIENFRSGLVWNTFMKNEFMRAALERTEFKKKTPVQESPEDLEKIRQELSGGGGEPAAEEALGRVTKIQDLEKLYELVKPAEGAQIDGRSRLLLAKILMRMLGVLQSDDLELGRRYVRDGPGYARDALSHLEAALSSTEDAAKKAGILALEIQIFEQLQDEPGRESATGVLYQTLEKALGAGQMDVVTAIGLADSAGDEAARELRARFAEKLGPEKSSAILTDLETRAAAELGAKNYRKAAGLYGEYLGILKKSAADEAVLAFIEKVSKAFIAAQQFGQAEWFYREYLKSPGVSAETQEKIHYELAQILVWKEDKAGAIRAYRLFTEKFRSSPRVPKVLMNMANLESALGNKPVAIQILQRVVNQYSTSPEAEEALYLTGMVHYHTGNYGKAVQVWEDFRKQYPASRMNRTVVDYIDRAQAKAAQA